MFSPPQTGLQRRSSMCAHARILSARAGGRTYTPIQYCMEHIPDSGPDFWDLIFFQVDVFGCLEDFLGDFLEEFWGRFRLL